jgi:hypothetical protein
VTAALIRQVAEWANETRALLHSSMRLAAYFGSGEEDASLRTALRLPQWWIQSTEEGARAPGGTAYVRPDVTSAPTATPFDCREPLARIISPILHVIVVPLPDFISSVRSLLPVSEQKRITVPFGQFSGHMARYVCKPIWTKYPSMAPDGWPL